MSLRRRSGQTIVFLITMLVILFFAALWIFDLHSTLRVKQLSQDAGDSAAMMAARWQGITLNLVGDLNLMKAVALAGSDRSTVEAIDEAQKRLCFVCPMIGLMASQQAAKNNRIYSNTNFDLISLWAQRVRDDYPTVYTNPPYEDAWTEYADMLDLVASDGVAAEPLNPDFYSDYNGYHLLLDPDFYYAVAAPDKCWLAEHARDAWNAASADGTRNHSDWGQLPSFTRELVNCEFYSPRLSRVEAKLTDVGDFTTISSLATSRRIGTLSPNSGLTNAIAWYCYNGDWTDWTAMSTTGSYPFPLTGTLLPESDYAGADAFLGVQATAHRLTPAPSGTTNSTVCTWTAAAKPFGYLGTETDKEKPNKYEIVLPAFRKARLIPTDASSGATGGGYDIYWVRHKHFHLPEYMEDGTTSGQCWFCQQIVKWESDSTFESEANPPDGWATPGWEDNPANCTPPPPGGPGGGGGGGSGRRQRGH